MVYKYNHESNLDKNEDRSHEKNISYYDDDQSSSSSESFDLEQSAIYSPKGAWKILVLIGSLLSVGIVDGISYSYGLHAVEIVDNDVTYNERVKQLDLLFLPGALIFGVCFMSTPLVYLINGIFQSRTVGVVASLMGCILFFMASYSESWNQFISLFGICGGIISCLVYLSAISVLSTWFPNSRVNAVGAVCCGTGFGTIVISLIIQKSFEYIGWKGTLIIISGILLQVVVLFTLFRPIQKQIIIESLLGLDKKTVNKEVKSKRVVDVSNGTILGRALNLKKRLRASSTGSLDGMIITRANELVHLPNKTDYSAVQQAAIAYAKRINVDQESSPSEKALLFNQNTSTNSSLKYRPKQSNFHHATPTHLKKMSRIILREIEGKENLQQYLTQPIIERQKSNSFVSQLQSIGKSFSSDIHINTDMRHSTTNDAKLTRNKAKANTNRVGLLKNANESSLPLIDYHHEVLKKQEQLNKIITDEIAKRDYSEEVKYEIKLCIYAELRRIVSKSATLCSSYQVNPLVLDSFDKTSQSRSCENVDKRGLLKKSSSHASSMLESTSLISTTASQSRTRIIDRVTEFPTVQEVVNGVIPAPIGDVANENGCLSESKLGSIATKKPVHYNGPSSVKRSCLFNCWDTIKYIAEKVDLGLFLNPSFVITLVASTCNAFVTIMPYFYIPLLIYVSDGEKPASEDLRASIQSEKALCLAGFGGVLGRILGTLYIRRGMEVQKMEYELQKKSNSTCRLANCLLFNTLVSGLLSLSILFFPWAIRGTNLFNDLERFQDLGPASNYRRVNLEVVNETKALMTSTTRTSIFHVGTVIFGLTSAIMISLRGVLLSELFGMIRITNVFNYLLFFQGFGVISGFYFIGKLSFSMCGDMKCPRSSENRLSGILDGGDCVIYTEAAFYATFYISMLATILFALLKFVKVDSCHRKVSTHDNTHDDF